MLLKKALFQLMFIFNIPEPTTNGNNDDVAASPVNRLLNGGNINNLYG